MRSADVLEVAHHHPGRLRLRSRVFEGPDTFTGDIRRAVRNMKGVTGVAHDDRTGSLLVSYQPGRIEADAVIGAVADASGLEVKRPTPASADESERIALRLIELAQKVDDLATHLTGGRVGMGLVVPAALIGMSVYSFVACPAQRMPRWDNLLFWSYRFFVELHQPEIKAQRKRGKAPIALANPRLHPTH